MLSWIPFNQAQFGITECQQDRIATTFGVLDLDSSQRCHSTRQGIFCNKDKFGVLAMGTLLERKDLKEGCTSNNEVVGICRSEWDREGVRDT